MIEDAADGISNRHEYNPLIRDNEYAPAGKSPQAQRIDAKPLVLGRIEWDVFYPNEPQRYSTSG
ncbi:MAG: hypothetical protein M3P30_12860 [Chloroflexota bacterium]|nr:hypothetical protein [Chloroflexota bacterium]